MAGHGSQQQGSGSLVASSPSVWATRAGHSHYRLGISIAATDLVGGVGFVSDVYVVLVCDMSLWPATQVKAVIAFRWTWRRRALC